MQKRFPVLAVVAVLAIVSASLGVSVAALSSSDTDGRRGFEGSASYSQIG